MNSTKSILDELKLQNIIILDDRNYSSALQIVDNVNLLKLHFHQKGIGPGHKVLLCLANSKYFCEYFFAAWEIGACIVPLSPQSTKVEIEYIVRKIRPSLIVYADQKEEFLNNYSKTEMDNILILYTSGSSGRPKGVVLTREALINKMITYSANLPLEHFTNTLCMLPLNFGHGLITNFLFPILKGCQLILAPASRLDIYSSLGEIIDEFDITCFSSVPSILKIACHFGNSPKKNSLKRIFCASAPLDTATWNKAFEWSAGVRVNNMYGMTELASWIAGDQQITNSAYQENIFDYPWEAKIKTIKQSASDEFGEIFVKSNSMMSSYYEDKENSQKVLQNSWFKTGDIGEISGSRIRLIGRVDDVINLGGIKIYPEEVNQLIRQHPKVFDCYTLGLKTKESKSDHAIGCVIVPIPGQNLNIIEIQEMCKDHMASYKIPSQYKVLDKMPKNERGKNDRSRIESYFMPKIKES